MLAITIVLFVVPHNQQFAKILQFFHIPYFSVPKPKSQYIKKTDTNVSVFNLNKFN